LRVPGLRAAIVGAGLMGRWHAEYAARAGARVAAVVDLEETAAAALCSRFPGAVSFRSLEDCLARCPLDVVHVCTRLDSHAPLAETALRARKHVLLEKPAAASAAEVRRLVELAAGAGLTLSAVHQMPFQRGFQRVLEALPRLGDIVRIAYLASTAGGVGLSPPERRALLLEILPHPVSLFRALVGEGNPTFETLSFTDDDLELAGSHRGTRLAIAISLRARPTRNELIVAGTSATATVDLYHGYAAIDRAGVSRTDKVLAPFRRGTRLLSAAGANLARRVVQREPAYPGLRQLIDRYYRSVGEGAPPPVVAGEMIEAALLMEQVAGARSPARSAGAEGAQNLTRRPS